MFHHQTRAYFPLGSFLLLNLCQFSQLNVMSANSRQTGEIYTGYLFRLVYGLLLVRERFRIRYQTRMYIRLFDGDAISQPSMYAHSDAS